MHRQNQMGFSSIIIISIFAFLTLLLIAYEIYQYNFAVNELTVAKHIPEYSNTTRYGCSYEVWIPSTGVSCVVDTTDTLEQIASFYVKAMEDEGWIGYLDMERLTGKYFKNINGDWYVLTFTFQRPVPEKGFYFYVVKDPTGEAKKPIETYANNLKSAGLLGFVPSTLSNCKVTTEIQNIIYECDAEVPADGKYYMYTEFSALSSSSGGKKIDYYNPKNTILMDDVPFKVEGENMITKGKHHLVIIADKEMNIYGDKLLANSNVPVFTGKIILDRWEVRTTIDSETGGVDFKLFQKLEQPLESDEFTVNYEEDLQN